ncbi:MAG: tol-pal system protein YbgF, partial [Parvibaculaceae bacterium]|nr:tol-pal system protein YbgF [Parvibaculaceae bacterium]
LQSVEEQLRHITGRMEELAFQVNQSRERFNKFSQDVDYRFQQGGGGSVQLNKPKSTSKDTSAGTGVSKAAAATVGTLGSMPVKATAVVLNADPKQAYKQAFNTLQRGEYDVAEASFTQFLKSYPSDDLAGNAQYWLGESYYVRGAYKQAAQSFLKGYTTYSASPKAPDSLLKLGMTLVRLGQTDAACGTLGELNRRFPSAPPAINQRAQLERQRAGC